MGVRHVAGWGAVTVVVVALLVCFGLERREHGSKTDLPAGSTFVKAATEDSQEDLWNDDMFELFKPQYEQYMQDCPLYFYRRTCGTQSSGSVQVIVPLHKWKLHELTSEENVTNFMLFIRFILETFWRKVVNVDSENQVVIIVDMKGFSASNMFFLWSGMSRAFNLASQTLKRASGKSWSKAYLVNASYSVTKLLDLLSSFVRIRRHDLVVLPSTEDDDAQVLRKELGAKCLWVGYGGDSTVGLGEAALQRKVTKFVFQGGDKSTATESPEATGTAEGTVNEYTDVAEETQKVTDGSTAKTVDGDVGKDAAKAHSTQSRARTGHTATARKRRRGSNAGTKPKKDDGGDNIHDHGRKRHRGNNTTTEITRSDGLVNEMDGARS